MLVLQNGETLGTLGGGCVEAEVRKQALQLILSGESKLLTFKLNHDYGWDDGLVCGGTMMMSVNVVTNPENAKPWLDADLALQSGHTSTITINGIDESNHPQTFHLDYHPTEQLVIAGGGHVGQALAMIASKLDFEITVIDDRHDYASEQRFPGAKCIVGPIENELQKLTITPHTYIVIVTRGHKHDASALGSVVNSDAKYIGLIGSKRKILTIYSDLVSQGVSESVLAKVHSPIGLNLGAVTPMEIAISIAAELVAVRRGSEIKQIAPMRLTEGELSKITPKSNQRS